MSAFEQQEKDRALPSPLLLGRIDPPQSGKWGSDCANSRHRPPGTSRRRSAIRTLTRCARNCTGYSARSRAAKTIPWDANRTALYRAIFPQMTGCLPEHEGAQLRFDFETEMARLEAAKSRVRGARPNERASVCRSPSVIRSGKVKPSWGFNSSRLLEQERSYLDGATKSHFDPQETLAGSKSRNAR